MIMPENEIEIEGQAPPQTEPEPQPVTPKVPKKRGRPKRKRRTKEQIEVAKILAEARKVKNKPPADESGDFSMEEVSEDGPSQADLKDIARQEKEERSARKIFDELFIRRCVKKEGGFRKNLPAALRNKCIRLLEEMGREKPVWDRKIIPEDRYDGPLLTEAQKKENAEIAALKV